jgi:salicylate hydroxylase
VGIVRQNLFSKDSPLRMSRDAKRPRLDMENHIGVCIIGGGLGGLACALSLQQAGFVNVKVFERDASFDDRMQGYGLTLTNNDKGPLAKLGVLSECISTDCPSLCHWVFNEQGEIIGYYGRSFAQSQTTVNATLNSTDNSSNTRGNLRVPRQNLRKMLLSRLHPNTVQWGFKLEGYQEEDSHIHVKFSKVEIETGKITFESHDFDVLVGADGLNSVVRQFRDAEEFQYPLPAAVPTALPSAESSRSKGSELPQPTITPTIGKYQYGSLGLPSHTPLSYLGVSVIIGLSSFKHPLVNQQGFYVYEGTHRLFTMPFREEKDAETDTDSKKSQLHMWQLSFSGLSLKDALKLRSMTHTELLNEALQRTTNWNENGLPMNELITNTDEGQIWGTPLYDRDTLILHGKQAQSKGIKSNVKYNQKGAIGSRVTLLGDAAHPMSMFKGQGANQALEDAPLLVHWLLGQPNLKIKNNNKRKKKNDNDSECCNINDNATDGSSDANKVPKPLSRSVLLSRLRCFEREMTARASVKQAASRAAAKALHGISEQVELLSQHGDVTYSSIPLPSHPPPLPLMGFEGVLDEYKYAKQKSTSTSASASASDGVTEESRVLRTLHDALIANKVTAKCASCDTTSEMFDEKVREVIEKVSGSLNQEKAKSS